MSWKQNLKSSYQRNIRAEKCGAANHEIKLIPLPISDLIQLLKVTPGLGVDKVGLLVIRKKEQ